MAKAYQLTKKKSICKSDPRCSEFNSCKVLSFNYPPSNEKGRSVLRKKDIPKMETGRDESGDLLAVTGGDQKEGERGITVSVTVHMPRKFLPIVDNER
jgi:hypothetical protein